jgi:Zn-dependent protease with chaperone function
MDFFQQQAKAHHKTKLLVFYFTLAVVSIILMIYGVAVFVNFYAGSKHDYFIEQRPFTFWNPQLFAGVAVGTLAVIFFGSAYKTMALAGGGSAVAESLGGRLVNPNSTNPDERRLLNVVEEMAIASGVPVPQVYVLDNEDYINAFAAGHTTGDAVVAVTRHCMTKLTRDELQGVLGHEFSHILNGDMRLNLRLIGILFGIFCIATIGRVLMYVRGRNSGGVIMIGLLLMAIGSLGVLFGRLIQAAVSRQREFLADASSVQFTRNPLGLSGALQKIGGYGSRMGSPHASDASHLFFGNALGDPLFGLMSTHPPIDQRIRAIDPTWDGQYKRLPEDKPEDLNLSRALPHARPTAPMPNIFGTVLGGAILSSGAMEPPPVIRSHSVLPNLGNPTPLHLKYAEQLHDSLPDSVKAAAREPLDAVALIYAMLLSDDEPTRTTQLAGLAERVDPAVQQKSAALYPEVSRAAVHARLPMINLALGTLRQLNADQFMQFSKTLQWLVQSDGKVELFEYVLQKIVLHHLAPQFGQAPRAVVQYYSMKPLAPDCAVLLSALANVGSSDDTEIQKAFATGMPYLRAPDETDLVLLPRVQCGVNQIDAALNRLAQAAPLIKKNLLEACIHAIGADGVMTESEAELLRAVADSLDCPMPPFVAME